MVHFQRGALPVSRDPRFHARVKALFDEGRGRNEIAALTGVAVGTVTNVCRLMGLVFHIPPETRQAQEVRRDQLSARRMELVNQLLEDSAALRAAAWEPGVAFAFGGKDNSYNEHELDQLPARDRRDLITASCLAAKTAAGLLAEELASASRGAESRSILRKLGQVLVEAADYSGEPGTNPYALGNDDAGNDQE